MLRALYVLRQAQYERKKPSQQIEVSFKEAGFRENTANARCNHSP